MSDFEKRLSDALMSGADDAPGVEGLAMAARSRSRRRRRTTVAVVAAAVIAAVAVPVGVIALNDGGSDPIDTASDDTPPASDTRIETWHDISVEVPASWGYGGRGAWCTGGEVTDAVVERPGTITPMIACRISMSYGVTFGSSAAISLAYPSGHVWQYVAGDVEEYEPGSWLGYWYEGDDLVQVNAADKATVQAIIDSVERVDGVDGNGCPVAREEGFASDSEQLSVCRYDAEGLLEQSERLSAEDTAAAIAALTAAPPGDAQIMAGCAQEQLPRLVVHLISADVNSEVILQAPCQYNPGITGGGESFQKLTPDVLYWALSPGWFGSVSEGVKLPDPLRELKPEHSSDSGESPCPSGVAAASAPSLVDDPGGPLTVCRMEVDWQAESGGSYSLAETTALSDAESESVRAAVAAAPVEPEQLSLDCAGGPGELFLVHADDSAVFAVYNGECGRMGAAEAGSGGELQTRAVTQELLDVLGSPHGLLR